MTMPGVGPVTSLAFKATIDDTGRFVTSRALGAHLGLTPGYISRAKSIAQGISAMWRPNASPVPVEAGLYTPPFPASRGAARLPEPALRAVSAHPVDDPFCNRSVAVKRYRRTSAVDPSRTESAHRKVPKAEA
jgi:transposase